MQTLTQRGGGFIVCAMGLTTPGNTPEIYRNTALVGVGLAIIGFSAVIIDAVGEGNFLDQKGRNVAGVIGISGVALFLASILFGAMNTPEEPKR
jgi:lipopolysaccharide export LptBFGC system permease protein LptF